MSTRTGTSHTAGALTTAVWQDLTMPRLSSFATAAAGYAHSRQPVAEDDEAAEDRVAGVVRLAYAGSDPFRRTSQVSERPTHGRDRGSVRAPDIPEAMSSDRTSPPRGLGDW
jgi:hypothetical protein